MYFAMDEIGSDNISKLEELGTPQERWEFIFKIANELGFDGVQFTPSLYEKKYQLSLNEIPPNFKKFRLTYHLGGWSAFNENEVEKFNEKMKNALNCACRFNMEDVSFHPPYFDEAQIQQRTTSKDNLRKFVEYWLPEFKRHGITLSLETHISSKYFVLDGLEEYYSFVKDYSELGVLIDISHNYFDGYSEASIIQNIRNLKVTGLHISDAINGADFREGTHLPIGKGNIDFKPLLQNYKDYKNIYGALEIKSDYKSIAGSLCSLRQML